MRKSDIVKHISDSTELNLRQADEALASFIEHITNALARGDTVQLLGFGSFQPRRRPAREGRNPQSGAVVKLPASTSVQFRAGGKLRAAVASTPDVPS